MTAPRRLLKLGAVLVGVGDASTPELWRDPAIPLDASIDIDWYIRQSREAEESLFDFVFIVDSQYIDKGFPHHHLNRLEPLTLLSAVATHSSHIGLVATVSTTYSEPFDIARRIGSLDLISRGRAAWNIVTSQDPGTAANFGRPAHGDYPTRYRRATESVEAVTKLWSSYEDGAFATDKADETFLRPDRLHPADHHGEFFDVAGPLNLQRSKQGEPVLVQAGVSEEGRDLSAARGEIVFSFAPDLDWAVAFRADVEARAEAVGRDRHDLLFVPALSIVIADTVEEAEHINLERVRAQSLAPLLARLARIFGGHDFSGDDLEAPFPDVDPSTAYGSLRGAADVARQAKREGLTLRQVLDLQAANHWATFIGTADTVADEIERWYRAGGADGFNLFVQYPADFERFRREVIPRLQDRGVYRTEYEGDTLRANLELRVPPNLHSPAASAASATAH